MLPTTKKTLFKNRKTKETFKWTDKNSDGQLAVFSNLHILTPIKRLASTFQPLSFQSVSTTSSSLSSVPFLFRFSLRLLGNLLARLPCSFLLYSLYCARLYQSFSCFHYSLKYPSLPPLSTIPAPLYSFASSRLIPIPNSLTSATTAIGTTNAKETTTICKILSVFIFLSIIKFK